MPTDINSRPVAVGDTVALTGVVREVCDGCATHDAACLVVEVGHGGNIRVDVPPHAVVVASHGDPCPTCTAPTIQTAPPAQGDMTHT